MDQKQTNIFQQTVQSSPKSKSDHKIFKKSTSSRRLVSSSSKGNPAQYRCLSRQIVKCIHTIIQYTNTLSEIIGGEHFAVEWPAI